MAYDKVVDSSALDNGLTQIANKIREKGATGALTFPSGFVSAIEGLSGGGATEPYIEETYDSYGHLTAAVMHGHTKVRKWCFFMSNLVSIQLPPTVTSIEEGAFNNSLSLQSIQLPDAITEIGDNAFTLCQNLATIQFPSSLITIGTSAFDSCVFTSLQLPAGLQTIKAHRLFFYFPLTCPFSLSALMQGSMYFCDSASLFPAKKSAAHLAAACGALFWNTIPSRPMSISSEISAAVSKRGWLLHFISALSLNRHAVRTLFSVSDSCFLICR